MAPGGSRSINKHGHAEARPVPGTEGRPHFPQMGHKAARPSVGVAEGLQLPANIRRAEVLIRLPPGALPHLARQGHGHRPPGHQSPIPGCWRTWQQWGRWRLRPARRPLVSVTAPGDGHSHSPGKDSRKQLAVCRAAQLGHHGETTKHKPKKSPRPSTAVHNLAGPQKMPDKGCFHFLQPLLRIFVRLKTPSPLQIVNS